MRRPSLSALGLVLTLAACTSVRYVKDGADAQQAAADLDACRAIAAEQAFRDLAFFERRGLHRFDRFDRGRPGPWDAPGPGLGELEHRYTRVCMLARGYRLVADEG